MTSRLGPDLEGRVAVVTGAGRGVGRAIACEFAKAGASIVAGARTSSDIDSLAQEITDLGGECTPVRTDVTSVESAEGLVRSAIDRYSKVDILVNSAGIYQLSRFEDYSLEDWKRIVEVNLHGTFIVTKAALPWMIKQGWGRVINIASTAGKWGSMYQSAYNASKHAVLGLTKCLALETAQQGIRVNAICPTFLDSPMIDEQMSNLAKILGTDEEGARNALLSRVPIGRFLKIEEVPPIALYLASDESDGMTGEAITLSGGMILI